MAGIGFVLRKLTRKDDLLGILQGFTHSVLAANGPWLLTILALGFLSLIAGSGEDSRAIEEFRVIIVYNFAISLMMSGPFLVVITRVLADAIYAEDVRIAPSTLIGGILVMLFVQLPVGVALYFFIANLETNVAIAAVSNLIAISTLWLVSVYLSALKDYSSITWSFVFGMGSAVVAGYFVSDSPNGSGLLFAFTLGIVMTLTILLAKILAEYPYDIRTPFSFLKAFRPYRLLAANGLLYNSAIWIDKLVMWCAPEAVVAPSRLITYPHYDTAMFLAYLTIMPSMAIFMMIVETQFYEAYVNFYRELQRHANLERILSNHRKLVRTLVAGIRNMMVIQGTVSLSVILLAPQIFEALKIDYLQIGIFRLGVFGSLFQVLVLMLLIILAYFDFRKPVLIIQGFFLTTNGLFAWLSLQFGFEYYGYGFFLSCLLSFVLAYGLTAYYLADLPYQTFVRNNQSVSASVS